MFRESIQKGRRGKKTLHWHDRRNRGKVTRLTVEGGLVRNSFFVTFAVRFILRSA